MKKLFILLIASSLFISCSSSMSPTQVNNTLPTLTKSKFISQLQAEKAIETNTCKYLVKGRDYTAPVATTVKGDLKNGAKGIDEWVALDMGNAYVLTSYKWVRVGDGGATQLHLVFDTLICE